MSVYSLKDIQKLLKDKAKAKSREAFKDVANCCNALGELFRQQGKYEEAIVEHEEELAACKISNDKIGGAIAHRKIGEALNELGKYDEALKHQGKYLVLAKNENDMIEVQRALATLGRTHFCHAEALTTNNKTLYDQALMDSKKSYQESLDTCKMLKEKVPEKEYMEMNCRLFLNLGLVSDLQCQDNVAINFFKKTIYIADKYQFREDLHRCHYSLAMFYQRRKNYSQSKREAEMAEKVAFQLKDKALICDDLTLKAQLFVTMADFESARRNLLKAYRLKSPVLQDREKIENDLRSVIRLCRLQDVCFTIPPDEGERFIRIYEKMGDLCSSLKAFSRAIDFYQQMLKKAEELHWAPKELNPIYVSLSQTYVDLKDYGMAIAFYKKELQQYSDNPAEACRTLLNIANAREEQGMPYSDLEPLYRQALALAEKADHPRLQATTLNSLAVLQETSGYLEDSRKGMELVNNICLENGIDLDDESDISPSQTIKGDALDDEDEFVNLDELIEDDDSDEEGIVPVNSRARRRTKKNIEKLNMKGETALHRACIKQDISSVRLLLQQKHQVNVRDNCGWTPLHEACNYGNVDIVQLLIDNGASVNDRGGKHCDGIAPLHDAASCGHIEVMEVLLRSGANPLAQTHHGESAFECLVKWRLRTGGDLDSSTLKSCLNMEEKLATFMRNASQKVPTINDIEEKAEQNTTSALIPEEDGVDQVEMEVPNEIHVSPGSFPRRESSTKRGPSTSAQREYAAAMKVIGSSARRNPAVVTIPTNKLRSQPALLAEYQVDDDWLEEDVPSSTRKPVRKSSVESLSVDDYDRRKSKSSTNASCTEDELSGSGKIGNSSHANSATSSRMRYLSLSSDEDVASEHVPPLPKRSKPSPVDDFIEDVDDDRSLSPVFTSSKTKRLKQRQLSISAFTEVMSAKVCENQPNKKFPTQHPAPQPLQRSPVTSSVLKLNVRIQDKVLLIPVEHHRNVQWLSEEAARRYYNMSGLNPVLSLQTQDGAVLNGEDVVSVILQDGDKIVGGIVKWDLQPLPQRYTNACRQTEIACFGQVESILTQAHTSGKLFIHLPLGSIYLLPVVKAMRYQQNLWDVNLSSTKMNDVVLKDFCEALATFPNLIHLNLSNNLVTSTGLAALADSARGDDGSLKKLQTLNLSFNPLDDGASYSLSACLERMPSLEKLEIESCGLTERFFDERMSTVIRNSVIQDLSIGWNDWSARSLELWLKPVNLKKIKRLSLVAVTCDAMLQVLISGIHSTEYCSVTDLDLSHCRLTDSNIEDLTGVFAILSQLKKLTLRNNQDLTIETMERILECSRQHSVFIEDLDFSGCALSCQTGSTDQTAKRDSERCIDSLQSYLLWSKDLRYLSLSFNRRSCSESITHSLSKIWIVMHGSRAVITQTSAHQIILAVS